MIKFSYNFELERIVEQIKARNAKSVGIQLPEGVRPVATELADAIAAKTGAEVIISGNSCYGACDIDDKLLRIVDILFHFGHTEYSGLGSHSLLSECEKVCFIELRSEVDVKPVVKTAVTELKGETVCVVSTVQHIHMLKDAISVLAQHGKNVITGKSPMLRYAGQVLGCDFSAAKVPCDEILFIGSGSFHPAGLALYTGRRVVAADPFTNQLMIFHGEDERKKRYLAVARALDATTFGIIIGMKSGQCNLREARRLKENAIQRGLTAYLIAMDEITGERLLAYKYKADAFVNTACPRLTEDFIQEKMLLLSAREFEVIIGQRNWEEMFNLRNI